MLLNYTNWNRLYESEGTTEVYLNFFLKPEPKLTSEDIKNDVFQAVSKYFPNAQLKNRNFIEIPNDKFEDFEGNMNSLMLDIPMTSINTSTGYATLLRQYLEKITGKKVVATTGRFEIMSPNQLAKYPESEITQAISKDIYAEQVKPVLDGLESTIENLMMSKALGETFYSEKDAKAVMTNLVEALANIHYLRVIDATRVDRDEINLDTFEETLQKRLDEFLIDYSELSGDDLTIMADKVTKFLQYTAKILRTRGDKVKRIGEEVRNQLLEHIDKYPNLMERMVELSEAQWKASRK
jgi:hypothetical protein